MNISNESELRQIDIDLLKFFFTAKASNLESLEEHSSGMYSTQQKLMELKTQLLNFVLAQRNRNSIFYVFQNRELEQNLKIVVSNTDEPDEMTQRFTIVLDENLVEMRIKQLSLSSKILTLIKG
jgi:hypothetical protein